MKIQVLREAGLGDEDLRWLVRTKIIENLTDPAVQPASQNDKPTESAPLSAESRFMLTARNVRRVGRIAEIRALASLFQVDGHAVADFAALREAVPRWDGACKELRLGPVVVKRFRRPAPNQEMILAVFQEEGWAPHIDDPLTGDGHVNPVQRLHDAIADLNEHQLHPLLRFHSDGTGRGVRWDRVTF